MHGFVFKEKLTIKIMGLALTSKLDLGFYVVSFVKMSVTGVLSHAL